MINSHFDDFNVVEVDFPDFEKYKPIFDIPGKDIGPTTYTVLGKQVMFEDHLHLPIIQEYIHNVRAFVNTLNLFPKRLTEYNDGWFIEYGEGGYQEMHVHSSNGKGLVSLILCFNKFDYPVFVAKEKSPNGSVRTKHFYDSPGTLRIFNSHDVFHGALPVYSQRRIIVTDFKYVTLD